MKFHFGPTSQGALFENAGASYSRSASSRQSSGDRLNWPVDIAYWADSTLVPGIPFG